MSYPTDLAGHLVLLDDALATQSTGNQPFSVDKKKRAVNSAQTTVVNELCKIPQFVDFFFTRTEIVDAIDGRISLTSLYPRFKGCSTLARGVGASAYQVTVVEPHEARAYRARGEACWWPEGGFLKTEDTSITDKMTLCYVWSPPNMVNLTDPCLVPADFQDMVTQRAAFLLARNAKEYDASVFRDEYEMLRMRLVENGATMFKNMESNVRVTEDYGLGSTQAQRSAYYRFFTPRSES